jgi:hypothetical protein
MKSYQIQIIILLILTTLFGCTFTQSYPPDLNDKKTAVIDSLKAKYGFEGIFFSAKKVSGAKGKHTSLAIKFVNGKTIPTDTTQFVVFEKFLGSKIKTIVKNPKEFDTFIIILDKETVNGNTTNDDYTSQEFKIDELQ